METTIPAASPEEAVSRLNARAAAPTTERVPLAQATGRVLAQSVVADRPSPPVAVSSMDGYAVCVATLGAGRTPVRGDVHIGREPAPLARGGVARIVTGAPIPKGADAVIKREDVAEEPGAIVVSDQIIRSLRAGAFIRKAGENIAGGSEVIGPGREIGPQIVGALGAFGCHEPEVFRRVRVGILVTGDELVAPGENPTPWQIRDSNGPVLSALLSRHGWLETLPVRRSGDDPTALADHARELLAEADALVVTGGVSMGVRDFVPGVLSGLGAEILFHTVRQRPGKPVLGAITADGRPVLALPGNPVSVLVTARRILIPVLSRLAGLAPVSPTTVTLVDSDQEQLDLWWHRSVTLSGPGTARLVGGRGSGDVVSAARSDGFVEVPPGRGGPGPWAFYRWGF